MKIDSKEILRWLGSIGIFYILIPVWMIVSEDLYRWIFPWDIPSQVPGALRIVAMLIGLLGLVLAFQSIRAQVVFAEGHPFDITGRERLSRPTKSLLTAGVYYWTRNPMGLGDIFLYVGITTGFERVYSFALNIPAYTAIVLWNHWFNERPRLVRSFGDAFLEYERNTSCLLPGPKTFRKLRGLRSR